MIGFSTLLYLISAVFCGMGFYRLFVYKNETYEQVNAVVGGDAYNYIINAGYATAFFTIAGILAIIASIVLVIYYLREQTRCLYQLHDDLVKAREGSEVKIVEEPKTKTEVITDYHL